MKPRNRLIMQKLDELSLVDRGGNQHANVAIFKRLAPGASTRKRFTDVFKAFMAAIVPSDRVAKEAQSYEQTRAVGALWSMTSDLSTSIASILSDENDAATKAKLLDASLSQFRDAVQAMNVDDTAFDGLEDTGEGADDMPVMKVDVPVVPAPVPPAADTTDETVTKGNTMKRTVQTFTDLALANAAVAKMTEELTTLDTQVATLEATADPIAAVTKGMPPAAADAYRKQADRIAKMEEREGLALVRAEAVTVSKSIYSGDEITTVSKVLKALQGDENKDARALFVDLVAKYDALVTEMEGSVIGSIGDEGGSTDHAAALEAAAQDVLKLNPKLTHAQAVVKALEINPALYDDSDASLAVANA